MSQVLHVECPNCGAPIGVSDLSRIVHCAHCGTKLLVDGHAFVGEYYVEPGVDRTTARRKVQAALSADAMPRGLLRQSRLDSARLYFIPYNDVFARRVGKLVMRSGERVPSGEGGGADTRVVVSDVSRVVPALALEGFGLELTALARPEGRSHLKVLPATREALARKGRLFQPAIRPESVLDNLDGVNLSATIEAEVDYLERRYRRVFYPVWRIRYRYRNRLYWATVDGVSGQVLTLRAPENDRSRLKWLVGTALFSGLVLGKAARTVHGLVTDAGPGAALTVVTHPVTVIASVFALGFLALLLSVGWEQFRYAGELVLVGDKKEVVKLNKPPGEGRVARYVTRFLDRLSEAFHRGEKLS
jgi:hypothetical protein